ncbi:MAG: lactate utilization protein [Candidatus Thiodiazotropha sp.]
MINRARDAILERLRNRQPGFDIPSQSLAVETPEWPMQARIAQFKSMLESARAEVYPAEPGNWTQTLRRLVAEKRIDNLLYAKHGPLAEAIESAWVETEKPELICDQRPIEGWKDELFFHIDASITSTRAAIAETGTLILWPTQDEPRTWSLVPPIHFVVVDADKLYNTFAEVVETEAWAQQMPSNALLISGPSKSADIQQTLAYGVHGPTELIVILRSAEPKQ